MGTWKVKRNSVCLNYSNHIAGIVEHNFPHSCPSMSSMNRNYYDTCKVWSIRIRVNTVINHSCAMAPLHALLMILKDVNGEAVCPVHRRDAL